MPQPTGNPDFSLDAKRKIVKATRITLNLPQTGGNVPRAAFPRSFDTMFYVKLTQTGGTAGTTSTACNFTYDVKEPTDTSLVIDTGIEVIKDRLLKCAMNAATKGWAFYDENGDLKIWDCNETMQQQDC